MKQLPKILYHNVVGYEEVIKKKMEGIRKHGLIPRVPDEWRLIVPKAIRNLPIVWLQDDREPIVTEKMNTVDGYILTIEVKYLEPEKLYDLKLDDVSWYVYQGVIPLEAIRMENCVNCKHLCVGNPKCLECDALSAVPNGATPINWELKSESQASCEVFD